MNSGALVDCIGFVLGSASALAAPAIVVTARSGAPGAPELLADGNADRAKNNLAVDALGNSYVVGSRWANGSGSFITICQVRNVTDPILPWS